MRCFLFAVFFIAVGALPSLQAQSQTSLQIQVGNPSGEAWQERVVEVPWSSVAAKWPGIDTARLVVTSGNKAVQLPFQLETRGSGKVVSLLVPVTLPAGGKTTLRLSYGKRQSFAARTYCRYVPERYEDFAWENDKIAFRAYGKALEATKENAFGIDVWSKRTPAMVIDRWYKINDYHKDNGEGLDYYKVGFTLGAGGLAAMWADTICYSKNYVRYEVLDNGPLRSTFRLFHDEWSAGPAKVSLVKEFQVDAGNQLYKVTASFIIKGADSIQAVAGIRKNPGADAVWLDQQRGIMGYWNPREGDNGTIGVGCIIPDNTGAQLIKQDHLMYRTWVKTGKPFVYYSGAAWDKAGSITTSEAWFAYLRQFSKTISVQPTINFQ